MDFTAIEQRITEIEDLIDACLTSPSPVYLVTNGSWFWHCARQPFIPTIPRYCRAGEPAAGG